MQLNEKLALLRKNSGYSTRELGEKLGVSQSSISLWEKGDRRPDYENIIKLASIYDVSTDYLLTETNKSTVNKLNELINFHNLEINKLKRHYNTIEEEISKLYENIEIETRYKNKVMSDEMCEDDKKLLKMIDNRIKNTQRRIEYKKDKLNSYKIKIIDLHQELQSIEEKYLIEKENEFQLSTNLDNIEKKDFKSITIRNEYQLQVIILKYLGIYDAYKGTMLSVAEIMHRVQKIIDENKFL